MKKYHAFGKMFRTDMNKPTNAYKPFLYVNDIIPYENLATYHSVTSTASYKPTYKDISARTHT